jgi:hypothetical protein
MRTPLLATVGAVVLLLLGPALVSGQTSVFDETLSTCTGPNCANMRIAGTVFSFGPSANTFVINAFANVGECVRFDLISPPHPAPDMEIVVVAPNGTVFRNDDRNGALDRRPLVKIASAPNNGWYTVHVAQFNGAPTETNIVLLYGRYNAGNPNCATPTPPALAINAAELDDDAKADDESPAPPPRADQPGSTR